MLIEEMPLKIYKWQKCNKNNKHNLQKTSVERGHSVSCRGRRICSYATETRCGWTHCWRERDRMLYNPDGKTHAPTNGGGVLRGRLMAARRKLLNRPRRYRVKPAKIWLIQGEKQKQPERGGEPEGKERGGGTIAAGTRHSQSTHETV